MDAQILELAEAVIADAVAEIAERLARAGRRDMDPAR
jgi:hypothetical protein